MPDKTQNLKHENAISKKIILILISIIESIGLIVTVLVFFFTYRTQYSTVENTARVILEGQSNNMTSVIKELADSTEIIAKNSIVIKELSSNTPNINTLKELIGSYAMDREMITFTIMDIKGNAVASTNPAITNKNFAFREYFNKTIITDNWFEVATSVTTGKLSYFYARSIKDENNKLLGIAVIVVVPEYIDEHFKLDNHGYLNKIILTEDTGLVLASTDKSIVNKWLGNPNENKQANISVDKKFNNLELQTLDYQPIQDTLPNIRNSEVTEIQFNKRNWYGRDIAFATKVGEYPFYFIGQINTEKIVKTAIDSALPIAIIVMLSTLVTTLVCYIAIKKQLKPIKILNQYAKNILENNNSGPIGEINSGDEFEDLYKALKYAFGRLLKVNEIAEDSIKNRTLELEKQKIALLNALEDLNTQKKIAELRALDLEKYKLAVDNTQEHIVITDSNGKILYANKSVERITGFSISEILGKKAGGPELWGGIMPKDFYELMWKTLKTDKKPFSGELTNVKKSGEKYTATASIVPVLNKKSQVAFFVGIERDITRERAIDRMKTEFLSLASHQLRTPLSAMKWFLEMLISGDAGKLTKKQQEFITGINKSNERMIELVNSLLSVSRIETGRIIVEPEPADFIEIVNSIIEETENSAKTKQIEIKVKADKQLKKFNLDQKLIRNVLLNLVTNAIKYSKNNGKIEINVNSLNDALRCEVKDNGVGIPVAEQHRITDKFFRASNAIKISTDGNGLGLYLTKQIIEAAGGKFGFSSVENKGSTFWIELPATGMREKIGEIRLDA
jgi:PAS domain S-box-containing protein